MTISDKSPTSNNSYDEFPYESYPFPHTRPEYLRTIGVLFGMTPPALKTARVLELGCSNGGNIINFAETYPKSYSLGVDLSKTEIEHGHKLIQKLGLKNIELKHMSITDLDESFGKFDYIICHRVFSWVPDAVKDKILEISNKLLNKNGISFISYNVLPGWNMINNIRDMMLFHSSIFEDTHNKVKQARLFLDFVNDSLQDSTAPYAKFLKEEALALAKHEDQYLRHEYLAEENTQFYFHQFMDLARAHSLNYLGDANIQTMYLGNLPAHASEKLAVINDIVRTEQYIDFIYNRRFRCTLLVAKDTIINRAITPEILDQFYTTCILSADKLESDIDLNNALESITFTLIESTATSISTSSPIMKAIFYSYIDNIGNPLKINKLLHAASTKLPQFALQDFIQEFNNNIGKLVLSGYIKLFESKPASIFEISAKPKASNLARYQATHASINKLWITTQINQLLAIQLPDKYVLELLDGNHNLEQITAKITDKFVKGELVAAEGDVKITDKTMLENLASRCVQLSLEKFRRNFILIA